jgi:membrane-associated phospholipid phosphatase
MTLARRLKELSLFRMNIDRLAVVYLLVSSFYPVLNPAVFPDPWKNAVIHGLLALVIWFVPPLLRRRNHFVPRLAAEIYLPLLFSMFYAEMEYLGLIFFAFEDSLDPQLIALEEWIFGGQPSLDWARSWNWPWFHELMEFAYFSYYFLSASVVFLIFRTRDWSEEQRWDTLRDFVRDLSLVMLLCYTMFTIWPAWGPKYFRAGYVEVDGYFFTRIMHYIHNNGALLGAAFPSSHVAGSMVPWFYVWTRFPRGRWPMTILFVLLCMSTVYCRYHYVVDVFAGLILGGIILLLGHVFGDKARDRMVRHHSGTPAES